MWKIVFVFLHTGSILRGVLGSSLSDNYYFQNMPTSPARAVEGKSFVLNCNVSEREHIQFFWYFNGDLLRNSTRRYQNDSQLVFESVYKQRDQGIYHCVAQNRSSGFSISSSNIDLNIAWIGQESTVKLLQPASESLLKLGGMLSLQCQVEGTGLKITWYQNNLQVSIDERVVVERDVLHIANLAEKDNGVYSCNVENEAGDLDSARNFAVILRGSNDNTASIRIPPKDIIVNRSASGQFDCVFDDKDVVVTWYARDEIPIKNVSKKISVFPNGTLIFWRVRPEDDGPYRCVGTPKGQKEDETGSAGYIARLQVSNLPGMSRSNLVPKPSEDNKYIVVAGSVLEVFCRSKAFVPRPKVYWINENGGMQVSDGPYWIIDEVQPSHAGNYICKVENKFGMASFSVSLIVTIVPNISDEPSDVTQYEGTSFQLTCGYQGSPFPYTTISWLKYSKLSGKYVSFDNALPSRYTFINSTSSSQFQVRNTVADEDSGQYRCQVLTDGFEPVYSEVAKVFIQEHLKFTSKPVNQYLELDKTEKVHCRVHASETITIKWSIPGMPSLPKHIQNRDGVLIFDKVKKSDIGNYLCVAETATERINATIFIDVVVSPKFTVKPSNQVAVMGQSIILDCVATGDPKPVIQWDKDTGRPNNTDTSRWKYKDNGTLVIENAVQSDSGRYGCTAGNKGGFIRDEMILIVQADAGTSVTQTMIIIISCVAGYILLVLALILYCKRKRSPKLESVCQPMLPMTPNHTIAPHHSTADSRSLIQAPSEFLPAPASSLATLNVRDTPSRQLSNQSKRAGRSSNGGSDDCRNSPNTSSAYSSSFNDGSQVSGHFISMNQLVNTAKIGSGMFGEIFVSDMRDGPVPNVLLKTFQTREEDLRRAFITQISILRKLNHSNVIQYVGTCRSGQSRNRADYAIFEHSQVGDLWHFLCHYREQLAAAHLVSIAHQIALGMSQLADNRYTHRDLAARNCIVNLIPGPQGPSLQIKISFISVTKDGPFDADYCLYRGQILPIRWMPKELVFEDEPSIKSDVWAYGITCYEIFTLCSVQPYSDLNDQMVLELLEFDKLKLPLERMGNRGIENLIRCCTAPYMADRLTFSEILQMWPQFMAPGNLLD